jgi:hypothetical protein
MGLTCVTSIFCIVFVPISWVVTLRALLPEHLARLADALRTLGAVTAADAIGTLLEACTARAAVQFYGGVLQAGPGVVT